MITKHGEQSLTLWDGERAHDVQHKEFGFAVVGGLHPAITEEHHTWIEVQPFVHSQGLDPATCPVACVQHAVETYPGSGRTEKRWYIELPGWLQAKYGPDEQIVSVPLTGDANAQRLHWLKRTDEERAEMKAVLAWLGAWRLDENGDVPA